MGLIWKVSAKHSPCSRTALTRYGGIHLNPDTRGKDWKFKATLRYEASLRPDWDTGELRLSLFSLTPKNREMKEAGVDGDRGE